MKKKLLMRLAAAALAAGMCLSSAGAAYFKDVSSNAWYYSAVNKCSNYGYMKGYTDGSFRPNATITRAECVTLLYRISDADPTTGVLFEFNDVPSNAWYHTAASVLGDAMGGTKFVNTAQYYAIYFYPNKACTREDFIYGMGNVINVPRDSYSYFDDWASINPDYVDVINSMRTYGIISGDGTGMHGKFNPKKTITRAEVAQILCNYIENYL